MATFVTLQQVNDALRLDLEKTGSPPTFTDERTPDVELKINQAEATIIDYLKVAPEKWNSDTVPPMVTAAIILAVRGLYDGDDELLAGLYDNDRKNPIVGLLQRLRKPTVV